VNIRQHIIPVLVKQVREIGNKKNAIISVVSNYLSPRFYKKAQSHVVLEQNINEVIPIYKDAKDYIICELRSTIQHEAMHRSQELDWQRESPESRRTFEELVDPGKVEIDPERAEENCIPPETISGQVENVSIYDLFEQAKTQANVNPVWKNDIMAATLVEGRAGEYLMQSISPEEIDEATQIGSNVYRHGNNLLIDVRKQVEPWIAQQASLPANIQTARDGAVEPDPDLRKPVQEGTGVVPSVPPVPSVPSV